MNSTPICDIIIPIAPYHAHITTAIDAAEAQTVRCNTIPIIDEQGHGPAWARNQGIKSATAPFVVFLDADDTITPDFVEKTLGRYEQGKYVYTNWLTDDGMEHVPASEFDIFKDGMAHTVTCLVPRKALMWIGGFDESLPGMEDIELYMRLHQIGVCGVKLDETLLTYNRTQGDSPVSPDKSPMQITSWMEDFYRLLTQKHANAWGVTMCKCKEGSSIAAGVAGQQFDTDVLVMVAKQARFSGSVSKRLYPKTDSSRLLFMDARDVQPHLTHRKHRVTVIPDPRKIAPDTQEVVDLLNKFGGNA
jgi:hypothetical protein